MTNPNSASHDAGISTPVFACIVLACLGVIDLVRGFLHTFLVEHSAVKIAGMDLAHSGQDQLMLLGSFGISNFLTGAIYGDPSVLSFRLRCTEAEQRHPGIGISRPNFHARLLEHLRTNTRCKLCLHAKEAQVPELTPGPQ